MAIRRYRSQGNFTDAELTDQVPPGVTATVSETNPFFTDIELLPDPINDQIRSDIDNFMASLGWIFVEENPASPLPSTAGAFVFAAESVGSTTTPRYIPPGYNDFTAPAIAVSFPATRNGTLRNLMVMHNVPGTSPNVVDYTVRVNGVPTALTVGLASNAASGSNTADTVAIQEGDSIDIEVTKAANIDNILANVAVSLEYA